MTPFDPARPDGLNASATDTLAPDGCLVAGTDYEVPARQGRAFRVDKGRTFRVTNPHGTQVGDFWAFHAHDLREFLSMEHLRPSIRHICPRPGDPLVTNRRRPILTLMEDTSPGVHDTLVAACDVFRYGQLGHQGYHDNCTDNLRMALAAIDLQAPEIPCPFNLWMNTPFDQTGRMSWLPPVSRPGDHVTFRAEMDAVIVLSCCPMDLLPINGTDAVIRPLHVRQETD